MVNRKKCERENNGSKQNVRNKYGKVDHSNNACPLISNMPSIKMIDHIGHEKYAGQGKGCKHAKLMCLMFLLKMKVNPTIRKTAVEPFNTA